MKRRIGVLAALLLLPLVSCFEPPVTERMDIRFLIQGGVAVKVTVALSEPGMREENDPLEERIEEARRDIMEGQDDWARRMERAQPEAEKVSWERVKGVLTRSVRYAVLDEDDGLARFFVDTPIRTLVREQQEYKELVIIASPPVRATREQYRRMESAIEEWSGKVATYLDRVVRLYAYLHKSPGRAVACLGDIFKDFVSEEEKAALPEPSDEDEVVLGPLRESMDRVMDVLTVPKDEAYSLDELSHLVYDPFPAEIHVRVPGKILELEGFEGGDQGHVQVPGLGLWSALETIEGRWLSPDPLLAVVRHGRAAKEPFNLDAFVATPRRSVKPPAADEVLGALREGLRPKASYRVRWSVEGLDEKDDPESWEELDR